MPIRVLFLGDICGRPGRKTLHQLLPLLRREERIDFIIANAENAAAGAGVVPKVAEELFSTGIDCLTTGDHFLDKKEIRETLKIEPRFLRPLNYPPGVPGQGMGIFNKEEIRIGVINLLGRVFLKVVDCPFQKVETALKSIKEKTPIIFVDFHAEATSEKRAMGWFLSKRVSAVIGTHTHIQTADEEILEGTTAYITDVGMVGGFDSVIGIEKDAAIDHFLYRTPVKFKPAGSDLRLNGVVVEVDRENGKALSIKRIEKRCVS